MSFPVRQNIDGTFRPRIHKDAMETFMNIATKKKLSPSHYWTGVFHHKGIDEKWMNEDPENFGRKSGSTERNLWQENALSKNQQTTYANQSS